METAFRTHTNGQLRSQDTTKIVKLSGWIQSRRDHGGIIFIDLRDKYGITQIVFDPQAPEIFKQAEQLRREDVVCIQGTVRQRGEGLNNPKLATGDIEVLVSSLQVINTSQTPPIEIDDHKIAGEDARLLYRYLDLRRPQMQRHLTMRSNIINTMRQHVQALGFVEIETPLLVKSTPEGARDYVVPSRVNKGQFYALPQSPQLYKQLLMVGGCDRYYQLARCLRDEDLRADRQPEHTQFDFEMSFVSQQDIRNMVEQMLVKVVSQHLGKTLKTPFRVLSHQEAMEKYGCDKPDLRYDLPLHTVTDIVKDSDFSVFTQVIAQGGMVKCIVAPKDLARKDIDRYITFCQQHGAKGMAWMRITQDGLESNITKFFSDAIQQQLQALGEPGSVIMFIADKKEVTNAVLDKLRRQLAQDLELLTDELAFCWVNDFPLFAYNKDEQRWEAEHHMFSMPKQEFVDTLEQDPGTVLGDLWDLVLNGVELASGSIRVSNPQVQERIMNIVGFDKQKAYEKFGFLLNAYTYGGPIHGGMGIGVDRLVAMLLGFNDIREVMAFPKNKHAQCPMDGSPSGIEEAQLKELHIQVRK
ncbi:MAG: aspartate--tRNA ligase [Candidatus Woesearchaeota archaeon]